MVVDKGYDNISSNEEFLPFGEKLTRGAAWEFLTRMDLDIAYSSEKVFNLEMFVTQLADRASDFDFFTMGGSEDLSSESIEKAFEFDILSGILNSEAKEIETFMSCLQWDINNARSKFSQSGNSNEILPEIEEKLFKAEEALRCSNDQVSDILKQSGKFERFLAIGTSTDEYLDTGQFSPVNAKWKLQTTEQQRHFLQTLEKSLEREMELERKLSESRDNEEDLKLKLHLAQEEVDWLEELMEVMMERMLEAENSAELLMGIFREYASNMQNAHLSTSGPTLQGHTLRGRVDALEEQLRECENQLQLAKVSVEESNIQQIILYSKLGDMGKVIKGLRDNALVIQDRAEHAEAQCAQLIKANAELNNEVSFLRNNGMEKANSLERKLKESDTQLEHAKASVEAIEEQQSMLYSSLNDMEHVIEDLKGKVSKAENRAESAENKCTLLTDTNLELNEELSFLRGRMECLEASLRQSDRAKVATAKDISDRTKLITELVKKLALERERLQLQVSILAKQNRILVGKCLRAQDNSSNNVNGEKATISNINLSDEALPGSLSQTLKKPEESSISTVISEVKLDPQVSAADSLGDVSNIELVRTIEASQVNWKYVIVTCLVLLVLVLAVFLSRLKTLYFFEKPII